MTSAPTLRSLTHPVQAPPVIKHQAAALSPGQLTSEGEPTSESSPEPRRCRDGRIEASAGPITNGMPDDIRRALDVLIARSPTLMLLGDGVPRSVGMPPTKLTGVALRVAARS